MEALLAQGLSLSRQFYQRVVAALIQERFPHLAYCAGRIGLGSEVLEYDTAISADHDFGPCVQIFLPDTGFSEIAQDIMQVLDRGLPDRFEGYPVRYARNVRPPSKYAHAGALGSDHGVELYTVSAWCDQFLKQRITADLTYREWLSSPEQLFLTVAAGAIFRDDVGDVSALRESLAYFPRDVWLYKLAAQWGRIAEERAYVGRTGDVGDEIGSRIIAARMVENIMRLAMLIERRYAPYPKWFGMAFAQLDCAPGLTPLVEQVLSAQTWQDREAALMAACRFSAELQVIKGIPGAISPTIGSLHARPYRFIDSLKIIDALRSAIEDEELRQLPECGAADQFISSNYVLAAPQYARAATMALLTMRLDGGTD